jgi:transcriptional regulator with XRE-family HTH domain
MQPDFAKYIKELRQDKGLSIRELASLSKVSHSYLSQIENNIKDNPSSEILRKIAKPLGVSYAELMRAAGYQEEIIDFGGYNEILFKDNEGNLVDSVRLAKEISSNPEWAHTAYRVSKELSEEDRKLLDDMARSFLESRSKKNK